jgi:hypothetical protein
MIERFLDDDGMGQELYIIKHDMTNALGHKTILEEMKITK